jgi:hypothetical protein
VPVRRFLPFGAGVEVEMLIRWIDVRRSCIALRPEFECRHRFFEATGPTVDDAVRPLTMELLERHRDYNLVRCTIMVVGKTCEAIARTTLDAAGRVVHELVEGAAVGGRIIIAFEAEGPGITRVDAHLRLPLRGFDALMSPLIGWGVGRALDEAVAENVAGLEFNRYSASSGTTRWP